MSHTPAHFARAFYEGIAFSVRDLLASSPGHAAATARLLGGGARSPTWRAIIANVTGLTMEIPESADASFGAALAAGLGAGVFSSPRDAIEKCVRLAATVTPDTKTHEFYSNLFNIYKTAQAALVETNHRLHALGNSPSP
jgi:xylulokinase